MILVLGGTGNIGSAVLEGLVAKKAPVRALLRDLDKGKAWATQGVELVQGDLSQPKTLEAALQGVDHVFLLSSVVPNQAQLQHNVIEAAKKAGVKHIVKISGMDVSLDSPIGFVRQHAQTEQELKASGIAYTILQPNGFLQNLLGEAQGVKAEGLLYTTYRDAKVAMVDVRDIAAVAVAALTEQGHENKTYEISGPEAITYAEIAEKLSKVLGKPVTALAINFEDGKKGMLAAGLPEWLASDLDGLNRYFATGAAARLSDTIEKVAKKQPITIDQFIQDNLQRFK